MAMRLCDNGGSAVRNYGDLDAGWRCKWTSAPQAKENFHLAGEGGKLGPFLCAYLQNEEKSVILRLLHRHSRPFYFLFLYISQRKETRIANPEGDAAGGISFFIWGTWRAQ
jgi:hypothetical protein